MKHSIISLFTIISLAFASTHAMQENKIKPDTVLPIERALGFKPEAYSKTIQDCTELTKKQFDFDAVHETIKILTNKDYDQERIIDIISGIFIVANFSDTHNKFDIASNIAEYLNDELVKNGTFDHHLFDKLYKLFDKLQAPTFIGSLIFIALKNNYTSGITTALEDIEGFFSIPQSSFEQRQQIITSMVKCFRKNVNFSIQGSQSKTFFTLFMFLSESIVKMTIRFLFADANNSKCIDTLAFSNIRNNLQNEQIYINFCKCFNGNNDPLLAYLVTFIELAKPLYGCDNTQLDLSGNQFTIFPPQIYNLSSLKTLSLRGNQLTTLSTQMSNLAALTHLDLRNNQLTDLPHNIGKLKSLDSLFLDNNNLKKLPTSIGNLEQLECLEVRNNNLESLPPQIGKLKNLKKLMLQANNLTGLPAEISNLASLKFLELHENRLIGISTDFSKLKKLTHLNLGYNLLTNLPRTIYKLNALFMLALNNNYLTKLPPKIGLLSQSLKYFLLNHNELSTLPKEIGELIKLTLIKLDGNKLTTLPKELCQLKSLCSLNLKSNRLTAIPVELSNLKDLNYINLKSNPLTINDVPLELKTRENLTLEI